jgi:hypothetical protein
MKTKEQIQKYNKEYSARPEVVARLKIKNATPEAKAKRKAYKKTVSGRRKENDYRNRRYSKVGFDRHLWQRYKISKIDYDRMFNEQNGTCLICYTESKEKLHVDHCHATGKVRGLLCGSCNRALGLLKDNILYLEEAIRYLQK